MPRSTSKKAYYARNDAYLIKKDGKFTTIKLTTYKKNNKNMFNITECSVLCNLLEDIWGDFLYAVLESDYFYIEDYDKRSNGKLTDKEMEIDIYYRLLEYKAWFAQDISAYIFNNLNTKISFRTICMLLRLDNVLDPVDRTITRFVVYKKR